MAPRSDRDRTAPERAPTAEGVSPVMRQAAQQDFARKPLGDGRISMHVSEVLRPVGLMAEPAVQLAGMSWCALALALQMLACSSPAVPSFASTGMPDPSADTVTDMAPPDGTTDTTGALDTAEFACPITQTILSGSDPYPQPEAAPACNADGCWQVLRYLPAIVRGSGAVPDFGYSRKLAVYYGKHGPAGFDEWQVDPALGADLGLNPRRTVLSNGRLLVTGRVAALGTAGAPKGQFLCSLDATAPTAGLPIGATCSSLPAVSNPVVLVDVAGSLALAVGSHLVDGGAPPTSVATLAKVQASDQFVVLNPIADIPMGIFDYIASAQAVAGDVIVVSEQRGWCARLTGTGSVAWVGGEVLGPGKPGLPSAYHVVLSADASYVVLLRRRPIDGHEVTDLLGLSASTGKQLWNRPLALDGATLGHRGRPIDGSLFQRWVPLWANGSIASYKLEWFELATGRVVGMGDVVQPVGTVPYQVSVGPAAGLTAYVGVHWPAPLGSAKSEDGVGVLGLADHWGNTTCEDSGPCWQKSYSDCTDSNPCTSDLCDAAHSGCYHVPLPDGITCSDAGGKCQAGMCN